MVIIKPMDSLDKLKKTGGKLMGLRVRKIFLPSGVEIQSIDEVQNHDVLLLSSGEAFHRNDGERGIVEEIGLCSSCRSRRLATATGVPREVAVGRRHSPSRAACVLRAVDLLLLVVPAAWQLRRIHLSSVSSAVEAWVRVR